MPQGAEPSCFSSGGLLKLATGSSARNQSSWGVDYNNEEGDAGRAGGSGRVLGKGMAGGHPQSDAMTMFPRYELWPPAQSRTLCTALTFAEHDVVYQRPLHGLKRTPATTAAGSDDFYTLLFPQQSPGASTANSTARSLASSGHRTTPTTAAAGSPSLCRRLRQASRATAAVPSPCRHKQPPLAPSQRTSSTAAAKLSPSQSPNQPPLAPSHRTSPSQRSIPDSHSTQLARQHSSRKSGSVKSWCHLSPSRSSLARLSGSPSLRPKNADVRQPAQIEDADQGHEEDADAAFADPLSSRDCYRAVNTLQNTIRFRY
ncbi:hypothetical protein DIPPA_22167 [Diplonema papillatum]|nr:hypothetical protein DIPPA_22167 [Diplonema papillatum]